MNKKEFISIIQDGLKEFPSQELQDIIYDYEEHFYSAIQEGKSEEEVVEELGDPYVIVNGYRNGYIQKQEQKNEGKNSHSGYSSHSEHKIKTNKDFDVNKILKLIIIGLIAILVIPIVFGLGVGVLGTIFGILVVLVVVPFSFSIAGVAVLISALFSHTVGFINVPNFIVDFPMSVIVLLTIGSIALSLLTIVLAYYIAKWTIKLMISWGRYIIKKFNERGRV